MRLHLAALGLLLISGCAAGTQAVTPGSHQPTGTVVPAGQSESRTPSSTVATTSGAPSTMTTVPTTASTSAAPAKPATQRVVIRPVTADGRPAAGFLVVPLPQDQLACGGNTLGAYQSMVAVDDGIVGCGPSAEYALACWNSPTSITALCYRDPWQRQVVQVRTGGRLPAERAPRQPSPLGMLLSDGSRCQLRDGGAWSALDGHPDWFGTYYCDHDTAVWGMGHSDGIDRTQPLWTVLLAPMSGHGTLRTLSVQAAYFVGSAATP